MADRLVEERGQRGYPSNIMDQEQAQRGSSNVWWKAAVVGLLVLVCLQYFQMMVLLEKNKELMVNTQGMKIQYESQIESLKREKEEYADLLKKMENRLMVQLEQNKELMVTAQGMKVQYESHIESLKREKEEYAALLKKMESRLSETEEQNKKLVGTPDKMQKQHDALLEEVEELKQNCQGNSYTDYAKTAAAGFVGAAIGNYVTGGVVWGGKAGIYFAGKVVKFASGG